MGTDVDEDTRRTLNTGAHLMEAIRQGRYQPLEDWKQALLLFAVGEGFSDDVPLEAMGGFEKGLFAFFEAERPELTAALKTGARTDAALLDAILAALHAYGKRA